MSASLSAATCKLRVNSAFQGELGAQQRREAVREEAHVRLQRGDVLELRPGTTTALVWFI